MRFETLDNGRAGEEFERALAELAQSLALDGRKCTVTCAVSLSKTADGRVSATWAVQTKLPPQPAHETLLFLAESTGPGGVIVTNLVQQDPRQKALFPAEVVPHPSAATKG